MAIFLQTYTPQIAESSEDCGHGVVALESDVYAPSWKAEDCLQAPTQWVKLRPVHYVSYCPAESGFTSLRYYHICTSNCAEMKITSLIFYLIVRGGGRRNTPSPALEFDLAHSGGCRNRQTSLWMISFHCEYAAAGWTLFDRRSGGASLKMRDLKNSSVGLRRPRALLDLMGAGMVRKLRRRKLTISLLVWCSFATVNILHVSSRRDGVLVNPQYVDKYRRIYF